MSHVLVSADRFFGKIQSISDIHKIRVKTLSYRFIIMEDVTILDQNNFFVGIYSTFREDWFESFPKFFWKIFLVERLSYLSICCMVILSNDYHPKNQIQ